MPYGLIIYAKIKTQRASKDVPEPVGSPAVIEKSMVSNLPLRVVPSLHSYLKYYHRLQFSPAVATVVKETKRNPKRRQRDVKKQIQETGIGTKSQQALKLQQEQNKQERKVKKREQKEADEQRMFELKQQKKREKHKGH